MPKYKCYQDYVIRDGRLIGEFEQLYRDFDDPWGESKLEQFASDKAVGLNLLHRLKAHHNADRVVEIGCGLGHYSARIAALGLRTSGMDVSQTAVARARETYPHIDFKVASIDEHQCILDIRPDVIVMAEVTWYVLPELRNFLDVVRAQLPNTYILHLLSTYAPGVQKYGLEYFTDLAGMKRFFGMKYLESGEVRHREGHARTWFLGTWSGELASAWDASI